MDFVDLQTKVFIGRIKECMDHALHANSIMDLFHAANATPVPLCTIHEAETRPHWTKLDQTVERRGRELIDRDLKAIDIAFHCGDLVRAEHLINVLRHGLRYLGGYAPTICRYGNNYVVERSARLLAAQAAQRKEANHTDRSLA